MGNSSRFIGHISRSTNTDRISLECSSKRFHPRSLMKSCHFFHGHLTTGLLPVALAYKVVCKYLILSVMLKLHATNNTSARKKILSFKTIQITILQRFSNHYWFVCICDTTSRYALKHLVKVDTEASIVISEMEQ